MKYLLDTNVCIELLQGSAASETVRVRMATVPEDDVVLCSTVRFELIFGAL